MTKENKDYLRQVWNDSWTDLKGKVLNYDVSIQAIRNNPTEQERAEWEGLTEEQITQRIREYVEKEEQQEISQMRRLTSMDSIAREVHVQRSPRLKKLLRP